jgi:hypothetical protein
MLEHSSDRLRDFSLLTCPRCGLDIRPRWSWLEIEHCPLCAARANGCQARFLAPSRYRAGARLGGTSAVTAPAATALRRSEGSRGGPDQSGGSGDEL